MSGHGSSYSSEPEEFCPCEELVFRAILQSVTPVTMKNIKVGDVCDVVSQGRDGPVVVLDKTGQSIGSIVNNKTVQLLRCIEQSHSYEAEIKLIHGISISVEVRPK